MRVLDNFLDPAWAQEFETTLLSPELTWRLYKNTVLPSPDNVADTAAYDAPQLVSLLMMDNQLYEHPVIPFVFAGAFTAKTGISTNNIARCKVNMNQAFAGVPDGRHYQPHVDLPGMAKGTAVTAVYYVNDCDGDTIFFEQTESGLVETGRVAPKKNRLVYFDAATLHAGSPPSAGQFRCIINFNFIAPFK